MLDCLYRALKPGGRLLFQMGGKGNAADFIHVVNSVIDQYTTAFPPDNTGSINVKRFRLEAQAVKPIYSISPV